MIVVKASMLDAQKSASETSPNFQFTNGKINGFLGAKIQIFS